MNTKLILTSLEEGKKIMKAKKKKNDVKLLQTMQKKTITITIGVLSVKPMSNSDYQRKNASKTHGFSRYVPTLR
jgi:hypothetical protein